MKKKMKNSLLSVLLTGMATTAVVGAALVISPNVRSATAETQTTRFEMVDGASIRFSSPLGMRFIAELGEKEYAELQTGTKTMGVFVMQYSDIDTNEDGTIDVTDYASVTKKLDYVFYKTGETIEKGLYEYTDESEDTYYRANAVIDLSLKNYAKEFVGVGYIAETKNGVTTYEYTDITYDDNVRTAAYVAIEAHADPDYKDVGNAISAFTQYIDGAQLYTAHGVTQVEGGYSYKGATYGSLSEIKNTITNYAYGISLDKTVKYVKEDGTAKLNATLSDTINDVTFKGAHAVYSSSNPEIVKVDKTGKLTYLKNGTAKITAEFMGKKQTCDVISGAVDFENGEVPSVMKFTGARVASFTTTDMNSGKVMEVKSVSDAYGDVCVIMPRDIYGAFFEDPTVQYLAFDLKLPAGATTTRAQVSYRSGDATNYPAYESGQYDLAPTDAFKSYYLPRSVYEAWVANNVTDTRLLNLQRGVQNGASMYIDNIRPVTAEEKTQDWYSFEYGGLRTDNGNQPLHYDHIETGTWQLGISGIDSTTAKFTSEIVSDGNRAYTFKKVAGQTKMVLNHTADPTREKEMRAAGYIAYDLYVPEGSNASAVEDNSSGVYATLEKGWNTLYAKVDGTSNDICTFWDSTASTYVIDNIRFITAEEYNTEMLSFEGKAGVLRDSTSDTKSTVYVYTPRDAVEDRWTFVAQGDGSTLSEQRFDTETVKDGEKSFAFHKTNNYMSFSLNTDGEMYALLKNGFTFWIYSTVGVNGTGADNFINGANNRFNGGSGISLKANEWTQVVVRAEDINSSGRFLIIKGSTAGTYYFDGFKPLEEYTITLDAGEGSVASTTQTITYGASYTLETPTPAEGYKFLGWYNGDELVPTTGTWSIESDVMLTAKYEALPQYFYNATGERADDGSVTGLVLNAGTHNGNQEALPTASANTSDMAFYRFRGEYGLNDFLVFDFTGNNMPIISFFTSDVKNSVYNHAQSEEDKGWIFTNGMFQPNGLPQGSITGTTASRLNMIGPYKISYKLDADDSNATVKSTRKNDGTANAPNDIAMRNFVDSTNEYRMIIGWVENGSNMNLCIVVWDLTTGTTVYDANLDKSIEKADWTGDIVLYGHFGKKTVVNKVYPIVEDTTIDNVAQTYKPTIKSYNATRNGNKVTLDKSTFTDDVRYPTSADMSYIAFDGKYGSGDYVVFDFTGDNMPIISFFNNTITNTIYNNNGTGSTATVKDTNVTGWVWANGLHLADGSHYHAGNTHAQRLALIGKQKIIGYDQGTNGFRVNLGSTTDVHPLSIDKLQSVTDTYRMIIGIRAAIKNNKDIVYVDMCAINMVTGAQVYKYSWEVSTAISADGAIILYGQFGKTTVLDSVFGVEEDTTLDALIAKYAKDTDYSDEAPVVLDRYAYSSISNGQWTINGENQVSNPTDFRADPNSYTTYKDAGFNVMLPQSAVADGEPADVKTHMENAAKADLKVILTDWQLQTLSTPIRVTADGPVEANGTYVPWILASDKDATEGLAADWLAELKALNITPDTTRFADRNALDTFVAGQLKDYNSYEAFLGVMLGDEPSYHNAYCYGEIYRSIKRVMPECYVQYNLLPLDQNFSTIRYRYPGVDSIGSSITNKQIEEAYKSYVETFLDALGTDYIQYDDYPFKSSTEKILGIFERTEPYIDNTSLRNIQLVAEIAKERGLDVKVVTQSSVMRSGGASGAVHIRQITEDDARWLNNYLMGFGVKQINYFTYWTKSANSSSGEWFDDGGAFVNRDGTTTALYDFMKKIMAENDAFSKVIGYFDYNESQVFGQHNVSSLDNEHITWSSSLTEQKDFRWVSSVTVNYEYALVTELYDTENYNYMYMVMNTSDPHYQHKDVTTQSVTVTFDASVDTIYVYQPDGTRAEVTLTNHTYTVTLSQGQAEYLMPKF